MSPALLIVPLTAVTVVAKRRAEPTDKKDLLNLMLNGRDPKTGEGMSDENIIHNVCLLSMLNKG